MLTAYRREAGGLRPVPLEAGAPPPADVLWIDLLRPTREEEAIVEQALGIDVPTRAEMHEIESSSRLYEQGGALFMTAVLVTRADTPHPEGGAVTFILAGRHLVTVRYVESNSFTVFPARAGQRPGLCSSAETVLLGLLETVVDRMADVLERVRAEIDRLSQTIFAHADGRAASRPDFQRALAEIGRHADIVSLVQESILSIDRLVGFRDEAASGGRVQELRGRYKALRGDLASLRDYAVALASKNTFLLDATLGMVNIEQNATIKIFSVVAVVFLPPTLIASIYGMNFELMPELRWPFGYPLALAMMVVSAILPYLFFKRKRWL